MLTSFAVASAIHVEPLVDFSSNEPKKVDDVLNTNVTSEPEHHHKKSAKNPNLGIPVVDFDQAYDHIGYTRQALLNDMDRVKVSIVKKDEKKAAEHDDHDEDHDAAPSKGYCKMHDWITVNHKAYTKDGQEVQNSYTAEDPARPKVFQLGHFEVSKCWDIGL